MKIWGYPDSRKNKRLLTEICEKHPDLCKSMSPLVIKNKAQKPYLTDDRHHDTYSHIVHAVSICSHLYPETIGLDEDRLVNQLKQLCKEGIIEKGNKKKKGATENYDTTLKTEKWFSERKTVRWRHIIDTAKEFKPNSVVSL